MRNVVRLCLYLTIVVSTGVALDLGAEWLSNTIPSYDLVWYPIAFCLWVVILVGTGRIGDLHWPLQRVKPPGYIGKFRRPDGLIVHVARLNDRVLTVVSEAPAGDVPHELGNVNGRELATWTKLAALPDG